VHRNACVIADSKLYSFGGFTEDHCAFKNPYCFDIKTGYWQRIFTKNTEEIPDKLIGHTIIKWDKKIIVIAGGTTTKESTGNSNFGLGNCECFNGVYCLDTDTREWSNLNKELYGYWPLECTSRTACRVDDKIYIFGGFGNNYRTADMHVLYLGSALGLPKLSFLNNFKDKIQNLLRELELQKVLLDQKFTQKVSDSLSELRKITEGQLDLTYKEA